MTADERAHIRALVDQVRREQVAESRSCAYCGAPIPAGRVGRGKWKARYCKPVHRQYAYVKRRREMATA